MHWLNFMQRREAEDQESFSYNSHARQDSLLAFRRAAAQQLEIPAAFILLNFFIRKREFSWLPFKLPIFTDAKSATKC